MDIFYCLFISNQKKNGNNIIKYIQEKRKVVFIKANFYSF